MLRDVFIGRLVISLGGVPMSLCLLLYPCEPYGSHFRLVGRHKRPTRYLEQPENNQASGFVIKTLFFINCNKVCGSIKKYRNQSNIHEIWIYLSRKNIVSSIASITEIRK